MPKRFQTDYKTKKVIDTKTGDEIEFKDDDGTLTMLASFLYNSMEQLTTNNKENNEIRN
jgi:hypothetical protein